MLITNEKCGIKKFLIVAPKNTLSNWIKEFDTWVGEEANYFVSSCRVLWLMYLFEPLWHSLGSFYMVGNRNKF